MYIRTLMLLALVVGASYACGRDDATTTNTSGGNKTDPSAADPAAAAPLPHAGSQAREKDTLVRGFVSPAFGVSVNGKSFQNTEDFYTAQLADLKTQAASGGYGGWTVTFDAEVGFADFSRNMRAFAASDSPGFAASTSVNSDGSFGFNVPATIALLKMTAIKRISVTLTPPAKGPQPILWCLNFAAVQQDLDVQKVQSVKFDAFTTTVTAYQCEAGSGGFTIPTAPSGAVKGE